jgi:hypothetical protein
LCCAPDGCPTHDHHTAGIELDDEIGIVIGEITVGFGVIQLEADRQVVFGEAHHIWAAVEKFGEGQLQAPIAHDAVEHTARWNEIGLLFHQEGPVTVHVNAPIVGE